MDQVRGRAGRVHPGRHCPRCLERNILGPIADEPIAVPATATNSHEVRRFGDFELLEEIGRGGMGVVYRARQTNLNRIVAVKMILTGPFASATSVARFQAEARAAARLQHPNIVAIHDVGDADGMHYYSRDLVAGTDLAELIREHPLPPKRAVNYLKPIAESPRFCLTRPRQALR